MTNTKWIRGLFGGIAVLVIAALLLAALNSCSSTQAGTAPGGPASPANPTKPIDPTTVTAQVNGDTVSISLEQVTSKFNTRFALDTPQGQTSYMAYVWNGSVYVRADICPPCGSRSFKLTKGTLVCNACGTVFDALSGKGKSGACVRYTKESVKYQVSGDSIVMTSNDLTAAYKNTLTPD